jgi:serine/threonine protein kinase
MTNEFDGWIRGEALGEGGQAWTYLAYRKGDEERHPFVLKVLKHKSNPARLKRFEREIEVGARLTHSNVVRIEAENIEAEKPFVVMEYCAGGELQNLDLVQFPIVDKLRLFEQICEGVAHIHSNGVIHRDLKPSNIFLRDDKTAVVGDLGLCLITEQDERLTETTEAVGGRLYMAPELEDGRYEDAKPTGDIYSLGKILYWLISNKLTSKIARLLAGEFVRGEWKTSGLNVASAVKRGLFTIHESLIVKSVGSLSKSDAGRVDDSLRGWLGI